MRYIKHFENMKEIENTFSAVEIYITLVPLINLKFDKVMEHDVTPFLLIDSIGKIISEPLFDKVYINFLKIEKKVGDTYLEYHNEIQDYNNFDDEEIQDDIEDSVCGACGVYEFYWDVLYDSTNNKLIIPYNYENDKFIPHEIKKIIKFFTDK